MKVEIRGGPSGDTVRLLLDGEPIKRCKSFKVIGPSPDEPVRVVLEIDVDEVDVALDVEGIEVESP